MLSRRGRWRRAAAATPSRIGSVWARDTRQERERPLNGAVVATPEPTNHHLCPVWVGYLLACPLRRLRQNPGRILGPYVGPGMCVMDVGCAMGFFSLPLARMVGQDGRVVCVDVQQGMLDVLARRAQRAGLADRVEARLCGPASLGVADLAARIDFVLAFSVVHEVADPLRLFTEVRSVLKPGARVLVAERKGRVTERSFRQSVSAAEASGLHPVALPGITGTYALLLQKAQRCGARGHPCLRPLTARLPSLPLGGPTQSRA